eukprot:CAMPEP_0181215534 /NCGR_PEP_ID=MMETSP1096-20121128/26066_1 /TAXON_ID=156174 ORGANISM="Chrysochromulina ericina, Strain CCMP281" /NCGR_SAMPLE_ID=MMETSP1096 /ASSEMBLY_ACC=CAM_ASM_000453 /LENGTH=88 /DNA_ID=CAMNT_0023307399 /DNA_START=600 /DNA_END=867 /DNA_ORIENTATION=+
MGGQSMKRWTPTRALRSSLRLPASLSGACPLELLTAATWASAQHICTACVPSVELHTAAVRLGSTIGEQGGEAAVVKWQEELVGIQRT